jgi:hypothetical protein
MPTVKRKRKKHLRNLERNKSGRNATVKMATYSGDNKFYAAPTITFKGNEPAKPQSFNQALEAGEVYEFMNKNKAERFAAYSWKQGKARKEAKEDFKVAKKMKRDA